MRCSKKPTLDPKGSWPRTDRRMNGIPAVCRMGLCRARRQARTHRPRTQRRTRVERGSAMRFRTAGSRASLACHAPCGKSCT